MQFSLIQPAIYSLMQYKCSSASYNERRGHPQGQGWKFTGMIKMSKTKETFTPTSSSFPEPQTSAVMSSTDGFKYISMYLYMSTYLCIYIFIYLYKHYICIHTIYVIYNICILHINSNKCICVILKIESGKCENWLYC